MAPVAAEDLIFCVYGWVGEYNSSEGSADDISWGIGREGEGGEIPIKIQQVTFPDE